MEADLRRFYGVDYRDRWRTDDTGRARLTLRQLGVYLAHLPPDAAVVRAVNGARTGWTRTENLLAGIFRALTGEDHPETRGARRDPGVSEQAIAAARARAAERRRAIDAGHIT